MSVFLRYFGPLLALFDPYFVWETGSKRAKKGPKYSKKSLIFDSNFCTFHFIPQSGVFFAGRSVQGFQKPHYFPMNRHTQFWGGVATVSVGGGCLNLPGLIYIYIPRAIFCEYPVFKKKIGSRGSLETAKKMGSRGSLEPAKKMGSRGSLETAKKKNRQQG